MRAMVLLVFLLAVMALFSFYEPLMPYWKNRFPAVMECLDEGRYSDALAAAMVGDVPGDDTEYWQRSEPLGEVAWGGKAARVKEAAPAEDTAPVEEAAPAEEAAPEKEPTPVDTVEPVEEPVSDM